MNIGRLAIKAGLAGALVAGCAAGALAAEAQATTGVNVRMGPGTQYAVVDQLAAGEWVDVLGCTGTWCEISHPGDDGWVSANYLARGGDVYDEPDYFYDDGPDFVIRAPRHYHRPHYRPHYWRYPHRRPYSSFCVGGDHARFCIGN